MNIMPFSTPLFCRFYVDDGHVQILPISATYSLTVSKSCQRTQELEHLRTEGLILHIWEHAWLVSSNAIRGCLEITREHVCRL